MTQATPENANYWLFAWLDSHRIGSVAQAATVLEKKPAMAELRRLAEEWTNSSQVQVPSGLNLAAGTGLRLNDLLTCPNPACRRLQIDILFRHAWHYFDRVLLPDGVGDLILNPIAGWDEQGLHDLLLSRIELALHIREMGAAALVHYHPRLRPTGESLEEVLGSDRARKWAEAWQGIESTVASKEYWKFETSSDGQLYAHFSDPFLRIGTSLTPRPDSTQGAVIAAGAHYVMHVHKEHLEEDLRTRHLLKAPLGASVWSHERVLSVMGTRGPAEILFELPLPSLAHVPIKDLIAIRRGEGDSFEAFRRALTKAAKELIQQGPISNPRDAAEEIVRDSVEPELARLNQKLRVAQRALARRSAVSVTLSTLTTACGLVLGLDPVAVGVAAMGLLGATGYDAISKYAEEEATIEMSDMYFLWKTLGHAE